MDINDVELPLGFGVALAKNTDAMAYFSSLSPIHRQEIIAHTHSITSKQEMQAFVDSLPDSQWI